MTNTAPHGLEQFRFSAKIDYLSVKGLAKGPLPELHGKAKWPRSTPGKLTVQDCSAADVHTLATLFPTALLDELEVSVDVRTAQNLPPDLQDQALQAFKSGYVAKRLKPTFSEGTNSGFRGAYDPDHKRLCPFNRRVPKGKEQLLYGHRNDGAQVKCYYKKTDNGRDLQRQERSVRVEVRLGQQGLDQHGVLHLTDLTVFKFRKQLMPYFTHVHGSRHRRVRQAKTKPLLAVLQGKQDQIDQAHWEKVGVGSFQRGGKRETAALVLKRDIELNDRIGQALGRLERSFSVKKFVREQESS